MPGMGTSKGIQMTEQDKLSIADLLNKLADHPLNANGEHTDALSEAAWLAGLNWSDTTGGWVIPGDDAE